jgi:hypothetical protein
VTSTPVRQNTGREFVCDQHAPIAERPSTKDPTTLLAGGGLTAEKKAAGGPASATRSDRPIGPPPVLLDANLCHLLATVENGTVASKLQELKLQPSTIQLVVSLCLDEVPYVESRRRYVHNDQRHYCYCCGLHRGFVGIRCLISPSSLRRPGCNPRLQGGHSVLRADLRTDP